MSVNWTELDAAVQGFISANRVAYDLVVGLHPDGVILATSLSRRLNSRFSAIEKIYPKMKRGPFFVFEDDSQARSKRESTFEFVAPTDLPDRPMVLVVDGVTTFGHTLAAARDKIISGMPDAQVDFFVYAVDLTRLSAAHDDVVRRLRFARRVDNYTIWLQFPWDVE